MGSKKKKRGEKTERKMNCMITHSDGATRIVMIIKSKRNGREYGTWKSINKHREKKNQLKLVCKAMAKLFFFL